MVPLRLLDEPWLGDGRIVVLEPRRLATRAAARRMATLLGEEVGGTVGYVTRDDRRVGATTRVEVVTEGVLTRRLQRDPTLEGTALVVFDEVHERNLQTDLGLALVLDARASLRPDLRLLLMSATLDGERFARLLGGDGGPAPVITSEGREHPVEVRWAPPAPRRRVAEATAAVVQRALAEEPSGDVLVFLPGAADIRRVQRLLDPAPGAAGGVRPGPHRASSGGRGGPGPAPAVPVDVRPLHGALPVADQDAALAPSPPGRRKVVLATDIAETSLTVEGVRVVVDVGEARVPRFDPRTGMTRLQTVAASRASADQRAGRAGRTEPGVAYRLWSKVEHAARRPHREPEITQVDLAGLVLEVAVWGTTPDRLAFPDAPPARNVAEAHALLRLLGALDGDGRPTPLGRRMAGLPLHPRLAHLVLASSDEGRGWLGCVVAALLEDRDVLRGPPEEIPADLAVRVALVTIHGAAHPLADDRAVRRARDRAHDLARRAGLEPGPADPDATGRVLALAYPDRVAQRRGGRRGRFVLRTGSGAWLADSDSLAGEDFLVAADLDGRRREARIRLAAVIDEADLLAVLGADVEERGTVGWDGDRDDLLARTERRLGRLTLSTVERRPGPGEATERALLGRVRATRLAALPWTPAARSLQRRVAFLRRHLGEAWPDLADGALVRTLDDWLAPHLAGARGRADLDALDVAALLLGQVDPARLPDLDRLAPEAYALPSGRRRPIDYGCDPPVLAVRVQELFGVTEHPTVADGRVPLVLHLLSPADRPVQVTTDLAGFWSGSWRDVRRAMAGRYPKHDWPEDPGRGSPRAGGQGRA